MTLGRSQTIERERRWARPAASLGLLSVFLLVGSLFVQSDAFQGDTTADQLAALDDEGGNYMLAAAMRALGFALMAVPLVYVFEAARARSERVRAPMIGFLVIGPLLFAAQVIIGGFAQLELAEEFVDRSAAAPEVTYSQLADDLDRDPDSIEEVTIYEGEEAVDVDPLKGEVFTVEVAESRAEDLEQDLERANVDVELSEEGTAGDVLAQDITDSSDIGGASRTLLFPALLGLIVAIFYTSLQAMRVGLLTRFFGTLGMAMSVSVLFLGLLGLILYMAALSLLIVGRFPGGRPPAWEAGTAIPWLRPGEGPADPARDDDEIDGDDDEASGGANPNAARRERARKKKRKRRQ